MSTRCKPADLAFFRRGVPENMGKYVTVLRAASPGYERIQQWGVDGPYWLVESSSPVRHPCGHFHGTRTGGGYRDIVPDDHLTPVRDVPGSDETLTWAGKPKQLETVE